MSINGEKLSGAPSDQDAEPNLDEERAEYISEPVQELGRTALERYQFLSPKIDQQTGVYHRNSESLTQLYQELTAGGASKAERLDVLDQAIDTVKLEIAALEQQLDLAVAALDEINQSSPDPDPIVEPIPYPIPMPVPDPDPIVEPIPYPIPMPVPDPDSTSDLDTAPALDPDPDPNQSPDRPATSGVADQVLDQVLDIQCANPGKNYFNNSLGAREHLLDEALARPESEIVDGLKSSFSEYIATRRPEYQDMAKRTYRELGTNIDHLEKSHQVGPDAVKVFLDPDLIDDPPFSKLTNYSNLQDEYSRAAGHNQFDGPTTSQRYYDSAMRLFESAYAQNGDTEFQDGFGIQPCSPDHPPMPDSQGFIHVNSNQPREGTCVRCYITADKTKDPSLVLDAWRESLADSPLAGSLYFKYLIGINPDDQEPGRRDDIVIYKQDNIDDGEFRALLEDFQRRCADKGPDLLAKDATQLPTVTTKIADGISISSDPLFVNNFLRCTDHSEGRHSWTTFIDRFAMLSTVIASHRLGIENPDSIDAPGLRDETHQAFHELMLLSGINPDTMLPQSLGDDLPSWAKLNETA